MTRAALPNLLIERDKLASESIRYGHRYVEQERARGSLFHAGQAENAARVFVNYLASTSMMKGETVEQVVQRLWPELSDDAQITPQMRALKRHIETGRQLLKMGFAA